MAFLGNVEYRPDETGTAASVKCPLVDDWTDPIDCMENQAGSASSSRRKPVSLWNSISFRPIKSGLPMRAYRQTYSIMCLPLFPNLTCKYSRILRVPTCAG